MRLCAPSKIHKSSTSKSVPKTLQPNQSFDTFLMRHVSLERRQISKYILQLKCWVNNTRLFVKNVYIRLSNNKMYEKVRSCCFPNIRVEMATRIIDTTNKRHLRRITNINIRKMRGRIKMCRMNLRLLLCWLKKELYL